MSLSDEERKELVDLLGRLSSRDAESKAPTGPLPKVPRSLVKTQKAATTDGIETFVTLLWSALLFLPQAMLSGWVITRLWGWFVVAQFPTLPHLTWPVAVGIDYLVSYVTWNTTYATRDDDTGLANALKHTVEGVIIALMFLGFGAIIALFVR